MIKSCEFSAALLFGRLERLFDAQAARRGLDLRLVPSSARIRSDPALLAQILDHLVDNAVSYTPHGRVLVGCRRRGESLAFEVWDSGLGLPAEARRLLAPPPRPSVPPAGAGLGLAVVGRLARLLRHPLHVETSEGQGTRFVLQVPIAVGHPAAAGRRRVSRRMVVVIDDEEQVLEGLRLLLEAWHFDVVAASSEDDAIRRLEALDRKPAGIIADYRLREGRTGTDAVSRIQDFCQARIPSIIITGDSMSSRLQDARGQDVVVLQKPVAAPYLHSILAQTLARAPARL